MCDTTYEQALACMFSSMVVYWSKTYIHLSNRFPTSCPRFVTALLFLLVFFFFTGTTDLSQSHSCWECSATQCYCLKILPVRKWLPRSLFSPSIFSPRKAMGTLEVGFFFVCQSNSKQFKILSGWGFSISCRLLTLLPLKRVAELLNISLS